MSLPKIAPSILAADFLKLHEQVQAAERGGADRFQVDVMDGVFVPNISFGAPLVEAMRRATPLLLEAHLMIVNPDRYLDDFAKAGADVIIVHQEAAVHLDRSIQHLGGPQAGQGPSDDSAMPLIGFEVDAGCRRRGDFQRKKGALRQGGGGSRLPHGALSQRIL